MKRLFTCMLLGGALFAPTLFAESSASIDLDELRANQSLGAFTGQELLRARTEQTVVRTINLSKRTGNFGGYDYEFGPPHYPLKVTMLNSAAGAIELLQPGMKIEVVYIDKGFIRIPMSIKQLPDNADVEN